MLPGERRVMFWLFWFVVLVVILVGGGRIASSDETSTFLTIESIVRHATLDIPPNSPNATAHDGKVYTWYEPGNTILGIPLYIVGYALANILPLSAPLTELFLRGAVSCTSAFIAGWLAVVFYGFCRGLLLDVHKSVIMTMALLFSTFLFPYFKLFMRDSLLTLCLLGGVRAVMENVHVNKNHRMLMISGFFLGYGVLTKLAFLVNVIPIFLYIAAKMKEDREQPPKRKLIALAYFLVPMFVVGIGGNALYNILRFGNPLTLGYAAGTTFTTPLLTGLFGLLLSPGKGLLWFSPLLILLFWAFGDFWKVKPREAACIAGIFAVNLLLYGSYTAWGGDGGWGPRYLAPLVPLLLLPVAFYVAKAKSLVKRIAIGLTVIGVIIQVGGTGVYAGSYLREIKEFPYQKDWGDPEFLYKSHFIPDFSPIIGHWRVLLRNGGEHLRGEYPRISVHVTEGNRLPIQPGDEEKLLHSLDFWFTYALYAGIPLPVVFSLVIFMLLLCGLSLVFLRRAVSACSMTESPGWPT